MAAAEYEMLWPAVARHADEIVSTAQETRKGHDIRNLAAARESQCGSRHVLLGDIAFEKTLRKCLRERLGARRVLHVSVERNDIGSDRAQLLERIAEGFAG